MEKKRSVWVFPRHSLVLVIVGVSCLILPFVTDCLVSRRWSHEREFPLTTAPAFLTEDVAMASAWNAMKIEGYDVATWRPVVEDRTMAPDGSRDKFLLRNEGNPNGGIILFRQESSGQAKERLVRVELRQSRVACEIGRPK